MKNKNKKVKKVKMVKVPEPVMLAMIAALDTVFEIVDQCDFKYGPGFNATAIERLDIDADALCKLKNQLDDFAKLEPLVEDNM
jgi:hypothetical protein